MFERAATWTQAALIGVMVAFAWLPYLSAPLLLDESATWWTISGGASQLWARSFPTLLYTHLMWAFASLAGSTAEWVLRLPSLLASIGTLVALYKLGESALGRPHRFLLPLYWLLFLQPHGLEVHIHPPGLALQARPYALAMCSGAWALYAMHRRRLWVFAFLAGLAPWFSFFTLLPLAGCALAVAVFAPRERIRILGLWTAMILPLIPQLLKMAGTAGYHAVGYTWRGGLDPAAVWAPPAIAAGVLGAIAASLGSADRRNSRLDPALLLLALAIAFLSVAPLFAVTRITGAYVAQARYMCLAFAPLALLYGAALVRHAGAIAQIAALLTTTALFLGPELLTRRPPELDLAHSYPLLIAEIEHERAASLGAAKVYLISEFVESRRDRFPAEQAHTDLVAPFLYYKLSEPFELLPHTLDQGDPAWAADLVGRIQSDPVFIFAGPSFPAWLRDAIRETHTIRVVTQSQAYVIAVLRKK